MKAIVVVAHPDDETIWSGGFIMGHADWDWTVFSLCRADDPDRSPKFKAVCRLLRASAAISDLNDTDPLLPTNPRKDIGRRVIEALGETSWDLCLTHGRNGEYGHRRHKEVHAGVVALVKDGLVRCSELWTFAYQCDSATGACSAATWADTFEELTGARLREKKRIIREEYGYGEDSLEVKACISPECFRRLR